MKRTIHIVVSIEPIDNKQHSLLAEVLVTQKIRECGVACGSVAGGGSRRATGGPLKLGFSLSGVILVLGTASPLPVRVFVLSILTRFRLLPQCLSPNEESCSTASPPDARTVRASRTWHSYAHCGRNIAFAGSVRHRRSISAIHLASETSSLR